MRTSPYSQDLRNKVIVCIESGKSQREVSRLFGIHHNTVNKWWLRYKREGAVLEKPRPGAKSKIDVAELKRYISENADCRLQDLSEVFGITNVGIMYWLRKLGYSYKKSL